MEIEARRAAGLALASAAGSLVAAITLTAFSQGQIGVAKAANADGVEAEAMVTMMENRRVISYPFEQVWPTAIRYLRVDKGFKLTDRDEDAGYVLFEFSLDDGKRGNGSLEMFRTEDSSGRPSVSVSISTGVGPIHLPNTLLDGLAAKVREERGQPAPPPPKDSPKPKPKEPPQDGEDEEDPDDGSVPLLPPASEPTD